MAEYIKREDLIRLFEAKADMATGTPKAVFHSVCKMIASLPADDVEEVRHGYWQPNYETFVDYSERETEPIQTGWVCSLCGRYEPREEAYCLCGAKMDGKGDSDG